MSFFLLGKPSYPATKGGPVTAPTAPRCRATLLPCCFQCPVGSCELVDIRGVLDATKEPPMTARHTQADPDMTSPPRRKRRHVFRWVFLAVQALFLAWTVSGAISGGGTPKACAGMVGQALKSCQDAGHAGTAIGVGLIIVVWAAVDVVLALTWLIFRRRS